jgi:hypothetical protein
MGISNTHHLFTFEFATPKFILTQPLLSLHSWLPCVYNDEKKGIYLKTLYGAKLVADTPLLILDTYTS